MSQLRQEAKVALKSVGLLRPAQQSVSAINIGVRRAREAGSVIRRNLTRVSQDARHVADEVLFRLPNPVAKLQLSLRTSPNVRAVVNALRREGFVALPEFVDDQRLRVLRDGFNQMIERIESSPAPPEQPAPAPWQTTMYREQEYNREMQTTATNDPFKHEQEFLRLALDESILDIVAGYFNRRCMLHQAIAARYYPTDKREFGSWQWHHDAWGKRINVMLLLTDVTEKDQFMSYMKGSHRLIHSRERYANSRFTEDEVRQYRGFERVETIAGAGTLFIFDPNGFHRGNRSLGAIRDTLICSYSCGRYIWKFMIPNAFAASLTHKQRSFLNKNPRINYV